MMFRIVTICFIFCFCTIAKGQVCDGNLGENIFTDGDFGSGVINIPTTDPGIAPGYIYTTNPPPGDGFYCLTNSIAVWNQQWGWQNIGDNSNDPSGYMMVVNASYDPGLFYEEIVTGLCENTKYVFSVDVINLHLNNDLILPNLTYLIDDFAAYGTGDIEGSEEWSTNVFAFTTDPGQTTVKLSLRNNAPGGYGNDLALDNISFQACGPQALILPVTVENICEDGNPIVLEATIVGDQFDTPNVQWQQSFDEGQTWVDLAGETGLEYNFTNLSAGTYYYRFLLANNIDNLQNEKCYIISNAKIVEVFPKFTSFQDSICEGLSVMFANEIYSISGAYVNTYTNILGCDSIVTMNLEVIPDPEIDAEFLVVDPPCSNTSDGIIKVLDVSKGVGPYSFFLEGVGAPKEDTSFSLSAGNYQCIITDRYGCSSSFSLDLEAGEDFSVEIGEDWDIDLGELVTIQVNASQSVDEYSWEPAGIVPCPVGCDELEWYPFVSTNILLEATSLNGCIAKDTLYINVREKRSVYFPNAFTPNGDNINDHFTIYGFETSIELIPSFLIYDRWGNNVFEAENILPNSDIGWNGQYNGRDALPGVYTYMAEILFIDGKKIVYSGSLVLMR